MSEVGDNKQCFICCGGGSDEEGRPLERPCSCRGSAGYCHLWCVVEYAKVKSEAWYENNKHREVIWSGRDIEEFGKHWKFCPTCLQRYQGDFALELTGKFVCFANSKHPENPILNLLALDNKMYILTAYHLSLKKEEARQTCEEMFAMVEKAKEHSLSSKEVAQFYEACAHFRCGHLVLAEGTTEGIHTVLEHLEKSLDIFQLLGRTGEVSAVKTTIAGAQAHLNGHDVASDTELLEKRREFYKTAIATYGQKSRTTLHAGLDLAESLWFSKRAIEAQRLLSALSALCTQIHGPEHDLTREANESLDLKKKRVVTIKHQGEWTLFEALQWNESGEKYEVRGPIDTTEAFAEETSTVPPDAVRLVEGTPVVLRGDGQLGDVLSRDEDSGRYLV